MNYIVVMFVFDLMAFCCFYYGVRGFYKKSILLFGKNRNPDSDKYNYWLAVGFCFFMTIFLEVAKYLTIYRTGLLATGL